MIFNLKNHNPYIRLWRSMAKFLPVALSGLYFGILLHVPLYNAGGFGTDLPQNLLAWIMALLMIAGIWLIIPWRKVLITRSFIWILAGVLLLSLPVLWAPEAVWLDSRLPSLLGMWGAVLLYFTLLQCRLTRKHCLWLLSIVAVSATVEGGIVLLDIYAGGLPFGFTRSFLEVNGRNGFGSFQQMNVTASFLATGLVVSLLLFAQHGQHREESRFVSLSAIRFKERCLVLCLFILCIALVLLQSRTGWVGAAAGCLLVNAVLPGRGMLSYGRRTLLWLYPLAGMLAGIILLHLPGAPSVNHAESNFQRWLTLSVTWNIIMAAPFQGWGTGSFGYIFQRWMAGLPGGNPGRELMLHPHNEILYQWMEGGIAGLLGCILIIAGGISLIRQQSRSFIPAGWVALLPVAFHTQTEFPLYYSVPHILVVILLLVCVDTGKPLSVDLRRYRFSHLAGRAVILMLCAYFIALLAWSLKVGFILSRYESQVSGAKAEMKALTDAPWLYRSRYDYDKNTLLLADFNATHEPALLSLFLMENARWLRFRISPDASYNQILVLHYLRRDDEGRRLFVINQQLFPWDRRFGARKH